MITIDDLALAAKEMGLDPVVDSESESLTVAYEMSTVICAYDDERHTLSVAILNKCGIPEEEREMELLRCNRLNEIIAVGKGFIDADGNELFIYQSKVFRDGYVRELLGDGLGCVARMKSLYIRLAIDFSK